MGPDSARRYRVMLMTVDFHVHSTASDGTCSPAELAERAHGFAAVALTDHDNCDGLGEWSGIPGIELSIEPGDGFDRFHLLGLGIDPAHAGLKTFLRSVLDGRNARNAQIVENFRRLGIEMPDIASYAHGEVLARPHFARWLMAHGYAPDVRTAFAKYLLPDSPQATRCYEDRWHPPQAEAFRVIHAAGGICVMAHPKYWRRTWREVGADFAAAERELAALREKGLDGLEALYQANTGAENVAFTRIATKLGLLKTAGSDFHGENKPTIPLGMEVSEAFVAPVLERLGVRPGRPAPILI
ncbi:MAG: PHP domain-containing protein [Kiritimatiellia bacterium]